MKPQIITGIVLIALGVVALAYQGITYRTTERAIDLGPIQVTTEKVHTIPLPPVLGGIALVGGIVLLAAAGKKVSS
ncbi:MAG: DUF3185 domain-containing protein [Verrucomicrobiaceae bacterium]|nr:MAG: DUF3185 domain-containing protein [Verrucomicrobiaceae bacterium]